MATVAQTLAQISGLAYSDNLVTTYGFSALSIGGAANGVFHNANAAADVLLGTLAGEQVVVLAFRGTDDRQDVLSDLQMVDRDYPKFSSLITAVDQYAASHNLKVVVTGHSLGGALAQDYMVAHQDGAVSYRAVTFGSPGSLVAPGPDARITNYEIANDPLAFAGMHRVEIAAQASKDPLYAASLIAGASIAYGVSPADIIASIPYFTQNYVDRGTTVTLNGPSTLTIGNFLSADPSQHDIRTYIGAVGTAADPALNTLGNSRVFGNVFHVVESAAGQVDGLYHALLGRHPDALGFEGSLAALQSGVSTTALAESILASSEYRSGHAAGLSNAQFVSDLYHGVLGRDADSTGLSFWTGALASGSSRAAVATGIATSAEAQADLAPAYATGVFVPDAVEAAVARLYYGVFGRAPDSGGLQTYAFNVQQGTSLGSVAGTFLSSTEFTKAHSGQSASAFVDDLYVNALGRHADSAGASFWGGQLAAGTSRATVAIGIAESQEAQVHLVGQIETGWLLS